MSVHIASYASSLFSMPMLSPCSLHIYVPQSMYEIHFMMPSLESAWHGQNSVTVALYLLCAVQLVCTSWYHTGHHTRVLNIIQGCAVSSYEDNIDIGNKSINITLWICDDSCHLFIYLFKKFHCSNLERIAALWWLIFKPFVYHPFPFNKI